MAVVFPVTAMIYSNSRVGDIKKDMDTRFAALGERLTAFEKRIDAKIDNGFEHMAMLLKLHEAEHHKH